MNHLKSFLTIFAFFTFTTFIFSQTQLTSKEQEQIIVEQNRHRTTVGVPELIWSNELASTAQAWADQVASQPAITHSNSPYGENIYFGRQGTTPYQVVYFWASEQKYYHGEAIDDTNYRSFGHYTQIIWTQTTQVGCGKATTQGGQEIWVCNYNPAGNTVGEKPYSNE